MDSINLSRTSAVKPLMKLVVFALVVATSGAAAKDWQQELSTGEPGRFPPLRSLTAKYQFGWSAFTAAEGHFVFSKSRAGLLKLDLNARTVGFVRTLWRLDTQATALATAATLRPVSVDQTEVYKDKTRRTRLVFDAEGVTRLRTILPSDRNRPKPKRFEQPSLFDLHTALLWVRTQRLTPGDTYQFVVYPATAAYLAEAKVLSSETITVPARSGNSLKIELKLRRIAKDRSLEPHKKFKRAYAWISDDTDRLLLKVEADLAVGSVWAELEKVTFLK